MLAVLTADRLLPPKPSKPMYITWRKVFLASCGIGTFLCNLLIIRDERNMGVEPTSQAWEIYMPF